MKQIELNGKVFPCRMTMGALLRYKRMRGEDVSALRDNDLEGMVTLMFCCLQSACKADDVAFDMDFETFVDCITPADIARWNDMVASDAEKKTPKKV